MSRKSNCKWPFLILRDYGSPRLPGDHLKTLFAIFDEHPGLIDEIWFGYSSRTLSDAEKEIKQLKPLVAECKKRNIRFSLQQGITLGHPGGTASADFRKSMPESAWLVSADGKRQYGLLCPRSAATQKRLYDLTVYALQELKPDSYWPDDDFRVGYCKTSCYCPACVRAFNKAANRNVNRAQLVDLLWNQCDVEARKIWSECNRQALATCARAYRKAVDDVMSSCRLGIQLISACDLCNGVDNNALYESLAGPDRQLIGIRPGAGYYNDSDPRDMYVKAEVVSREAHRSVKTGLIGQMCYETENWPHISAFKTPESQMTECALAMFGGMDSIALYWYSFATFESYENYRFYFDTVAEFKTYFEAIRNACAGTSMTGTALYQGENVVKNPSYCLLTKHLDESLLFRGIPMTNTAAIPDVCVVTGESVKYLTENDLEQLLTRNVLLDTSAFQALQTMFPGREVYRKIRFADEVGYPTEAFPAAECFGSQEEIHRFLNLAPVIPLKKDVKPYSTILNMKKACGTCVIPTGKGGNWILIQHFSKYMTTPMRRTLLDTLDDVTPGKYAARLLTGGFSVTIQSRTDDKTGLTRAVFLLNPSCGRTSQLQVAVRNPAKKTFVLHRAGEKPVKLKPLKSGEKELIFEIPALYAWQSALITCVD